MNNFAEIIQDYTDRVQNNVSVTENGAIGYKTTGKALVDLNFMLSSMRNMSEEEIWGKFLLAYNETPVLSLVWLFFARDIRGGCGERRTFRAIFRRFCRVNPAVARDLLHLIPEYGRWDDLIDVYFSDAPCAVKDEVLDILTAQLRRDLEGMRSGKSVSLLAKWLPSENTSSRDTRRRANLLRSQLGYTPRQYRQTLSQLRSYLDVVEKKMTAGAWDQINYSAVPSRAAMLYRSAFYTHDGERYSGYLENVKSGKEKINASTLFPHDIVHSYMGGSWYEIKPLDETLEAQWKALPDTVTESGSTLVVVDGSGSMYSSQIGHTSLLAIDVAYALGIYFSERLTSVYKDRFITFSAWPKMVHLAHDLPLHEKLRIMQEYRDCSNTDIEKTFRVILDLAVRNHIPQSELPANILIVSDMEFDGVVQENESVELFESIRKKYASYGYRLPRLVFWNVMSRTGTIPILEGENGVALVSGFSPNIASMVMSGDLDPWHCLLNALNDPRYDAVREAVSVG